MMEDDPEEGREGRIVAVLDTHVHPAVATAARWGTAPVAALLGTGGALVGLAGAGIPSYWGDEAASVMSALRPWPSLAAVLEQIDAVHGVYYAFLHVWVSVFGISEFATRLPSAIGVGLVVAGTVVLARQFGSMRFAVVAGIVCAILPRSTFMATEARSYALGTAAAVWITVLLVRLLQQPRRPVGLWLLYGAAVAASAYLFLYLLLMLAVHAAYVLVLHREAVGRWALGAATAVILAVPIMYLGYQQRGQIGFLAHREYVTLPNIFVFQWFEPNVAAALFWLLVILGVVAAIRFRGRLGLLSAAWLVIPTVLLILGNYLVSPIYNVRYLSMSTPAAALLIAAGLVYVAGRFGRPLLVGGLALAVLGAFSLPTYLAQRSPWAKDSGSDLRQVSDFMAANARSGDAVVFDETTKPSQKPRLSLRLYPAGFEGLEDVELVTAYDRTSSLWDAVAPITEVRQSLDAAPSVWAIELVQGGTTPSDVQYLESIGYSIQTTTLVHRTTVFHLVRSST